MQLRLILHATLLVEIAGRRLLVDSMLGEAGSAPPVECSTNDRRSPLVASLSLSQSWSRDSTACA